jgi:hypothetical protein
MGAKNSRSDASFETALDEAVNRSDRHMHARASRSPSRLLAPESLLFTSQPAGQPTTLGSYRDNTSSSEHPVTDDESTHTQLCCEGDMLSLINPSLPPRELARIRRQIAWRIHPDRLPPEMSKQGEERLKEINRAIDACLRGETPTR